MALFSCCNCDPAAEEEIQTQVQPCEDEPHDEDLPMTSEQKQKEKERLQALVKTFAKAAVAGAPCHFVDVGTRRQIAGRYFLDKSLTNFKIVFPDNVEHSFPIKALHEVYSHSSLLASDATASLARDPGIESLDTSAKARLVMLEYLDSSGYHLNRLFLMEDGDPEGRDRFITCMKILGLYAKSDTLQQAN